LTIESFEPAVTRTPPERFQYRQQLRIVEPTSHTNLVLFDSQTIGTEEDPNADQFAETWQGGGARRLKAMCNAAGVDGDLDEDELIPAIEGQQVLAYITQYEDDGSYNPDYKGQPRNRIQRYYKVGDREPGLETSKAAPRTPMKAPQASQGARPQPQARPAPAPARPAPQQPNSTTRAPLQRPGAAKAAPAQPRNPAPKPAAKPAPKQAQEVVCSLCGEDENGNPYTVPEDEFEAHVQAHEAEAGNA
jgi:hypothetical protein